MSPPPLSPQKLQLTTQELRENLADLQVLLAALKKEFPTTETLVHMEHHLFLVFRAVNHLLSWCHQRDAQPPPRTK